MTAQWRTRLRWRLAGAWQWPAFAMLTVVDAVVLARLPFSGGRGELLGSLLAAGILNVIVVAVVPLIGGPLLRRRRPDLPREVAADYVGTAGLVALTALLLAGGLLHRPAVSGQEDEARRAISAASVYAGHHAPARFRPLHDISTLSLGDHRFRTCFSGPSPRRAWCVFVWMDEPVPILRPDHDQTPNGAR